MNIFRRVAVNSLKTAKSRTIVTIVGVVLSACLFTVVTTAIFSVYEMVVDMLFGNAGDYQLRIYDNDNRYYNNMCNDKGIKIVSKLNEVGYGRVNIDYTPYGVMPEEADSLKPKMYIYSREKIEEDYIGVKILDGKKPTKVDEIIISESMSANLGDLGQIGDYINISLIDINEDMDDTTDFDRNVKYADYKIVGIFEKDNESFVSKKEYAFTYSGENIGQQGKLFFIKYDENTYNKKVLFDEYKLTKLEAKKNNIWYELNGKAKVRNLFIVIFVLNSVYFIIFLATCIMMSSTFSISYNERIKQLGLIKSLGATKRQLRKTINYEANYVAIIGVPIGVLLGVVSMKIIEFIMKSNIQSSGLMAYFRQYDIDIRYNASIEALLISLVFSVLTIKVAALGTLFKVSRIKTIEAIREGKTLKLKPKKLKVGRLFLKFASVEKFMSKKYYKASKKKYRVTVISLAVSIVVITSTYTSYDYLIRSFDSSINSLDYDIRVNECENPSPTYSVSLYNYRRVKNGIKNIKSIKNIGIYAKDDVGLPMCTISKTCFTDEAKKNIELLIDGEEEKSDSYEVMLSNLYVDEDTYMNIITEAGLDYIKYTSTDSPPAILYNVVDEVSVYSEKKQFNNVLKNPIYQLDLKYESDEENVEQKPKSIVIGDMLNTRLKGLDSYSASSLYLIYPDKMAENVQNYTIAFDAKDYDTMIKDLKSWMKANNISEDYVENTMETKKIIESTSGITKLTSNGFIVLVIIIAMANVFNTITANILTRKRDFAVLKSTGMSNKVINKMLIYECITYGTKAVIYGTILSGLSISSLAMLIYEEKKELMTNNEVLGFLSCLNEAIPWKVMIGSIVLVYIVVFISAFYALNRVKKHNIIETLKNDLV